MNRRQLREYTFKLVFHIPFYKEEEITEQIDTYLTLCMSPEEDQLLLTEPEKNELCERFVTIKEHLEEIDAGLEAVSEGWRLARMNRVDLSILRLAYFEMKYDEQVPEKVAINEAVELAKKYGGEESPKFVNGILAKVIREGSEGKNEE